jgi:acyl-CoA synthetase (AMP-forming)/AMP-acid ligase II
VSTWTSLGELLCCRATEQPGDRAYAFLAERGREQATLTFAELDRQARALAARLLARAHPGDRALLLFPPGLDFIIAFFGCLVAGVLAVPMMVPRRGSARDSSAAIVADCTPRLAITNADLLATRSDLTERLSAAGLDWLVVDATGEAGTEAFPACARDDLAFLQYTSGSTSAPKGVMVSHGNLLDNLEMIRLALSNTRRSTYVSWVPLYHDMGLIMNALEPLYVGASCVLLAPVTFMKRPLTWLHAINDYRAEVACAPNFAYDLCVDRFRPAEMAGVDLSCWKVALNGAEPVRADTIARFAAAFGPYGFDPAATYPGYGMAEATLMISGGRRGAGAVTRSVSRDALQQHRVVPPRHPDDALVQVGCGHAVVGERIAIVDPDTRRRLPPARVGEIWVSGAHVAQGYWQNLEATEATFAAQIDGEADADWVRTGDLGFLDESGELFITGRIKDIVIIRGINHYPQDIEATVQASHPALSRDCGAAFAVTDRGGEEKLVVVQEVERMERHRISIDDVVGCIREAVVTEHECVPHAIVLLRPGGLPKTTSGKIQRNLTRQLWSQGLLDVIERRREPATDLPRPAAG